MEIDGTPGVAFEARVEEAGRVLERGALGESQLHDILVRLTGADDSGVRPHRDPQHRVRRLSPFHLLDHFGVGLFDENADPGERLAPPITQLLDSRIDQMRGRGASFSFLRAALSLFHGCCFLHGRVRVGSLSTIATTSLTDGRLQTFVGGKRARTTPCLSTRMVVGTATSSPCSPAPGCSTAAASTSLWS